ncbi:thermonuclease family protein [Sphingopyxis sp. DHUNG17]|uniref:thermonuclease family protein n=1 Tax=Sphingopyxis jiangsuensis TaxID=2871171 RepID=UPI0019203750|nr:thermonuclease family protein [Sphingopyxis lutea]MBL0770024.1 thermonuclease family protein [Sphingopyxis lutea]
MRSTIAALLLLSAYPAEAQDVSGPARVVDGDSLDFGGIAVRIYGIDAPELAQGCERSGQSWPCGREAAAKLAELVARGSVACEQRDYDDHGRVVSTCRVGSTDLGEAMVNAGLAVAFTQFSTQYVGAEARARDARVGLWAGSFQMPADYRAANPRKSDRPVERARAVTPQRSNAPSGVYYRNCKDARAAGAAPIYRGQPGYRPEMDGDGDGIACEPYRGQ